TPGLNVSVGSVAANTSTNPSVGCLVMRCPPQSLQYCRSLMGDFLNVPTCSAPATIRTAAGFQSVKALTGPPDHERHERQWQYPMPPGSPESSIWTAPQKPSPLWVIVALIGNVWCQPECPLDGRRWVGRKPVAID